MGGRYCAINSPLGSRWGQKSLDLRSRDFCPHLEPRGELIAQYRPPMSFRYITQQGFHFGSPNFQDGFDIALTRMVLKMGHIGQHLHAY